jgi:class 3 adenylate cyclase/predicted ATPase
MEAGGMDVAAWLKELGLEQYAPAFRGNAIDEEVLVSLTGEDLKEIGIVALGHRKRLLGAIAALNRPGNPADAVTANRGPELASKLVPSAHPVVSLAERRQLTVMFCDLVGSTALAGRLDPEDLREVIGGYHKCVAETVGRFDGFVAKYMGDGVLVYFGYPQAHEDDAERAVRAGLELVGAVRALQQPRVHTTLQCRIGVSTGLVVVGDLVGAGAAQEQAVVGETPNLAARLQALAEPNSLVIGPTTRRMVGDLFECRALGTVAVKGFTEPVEAWQVLRLSAVESRFEALHSGGLTPLVGREEEIELLLRRWQQAQAGEGRVVLLSGEPGIGKSRIARALQERLADEQPHTRLLYFCSPHHQASALYSFTNQLERAAGFERDDAAALKLDKLEALLAQSSQDVAHDAALLAALLSILTGDRYPPLPELGPQKRKEETLAALLAQLDGLAARRPVLMIFEDAHWIDPTSLELLERTLDRVQRLPVLLIVTARPEFAPTWAGHAHVTVRVLNRLGRREGSAMIARLGGGKALPQEVVDQIIARTDGVPLFIEELTKAVLESGVLRPEGERYVLTAPLPSLAIPTTLHASLMARLDRLAPVRRIAEVGAVIGREFSHDLIAAVAEWPESELNDALQQLVASELIYRRGTPPDAVYTFKHALVQDAAYGTLLRGARQQLHACVVTVLEERFPEVPVTQPEILAHHCAEGGLVERAVDYWFAAGQRALSGSANVEAIKHLSQGLQSLLSLPDTRERQQAQLRFQITLGPAYMATRGRGAPEAARAYERADELSRALCDGSERFKIAWGLGHQWMGRGETRRARALSDELLGLAEQEHDDDLRLQAHHAAWLRFWLGEFAAAREHIERGLALYNPAKHAAHALSYAGHDPGVCARVLGGLNLWFLGYPEQAVESVRRAVVLAEQIAHAPSLAHALNHGIVCHRLRRDRATVHAWGDRMATLAAEHRLTLYRAIGTVARGWALATEGQAKSGLSELRRGLADCVDLGVRMYEPYHKALLAEAHLEVDEAPAGLEMLEDAMCLAENSGLHYWDAELLRLKGKLLARLSSNGSHEEQEGCYRQALVVARRQQARSLELRAATSLACMWRDEGRRDEARHLLAPIYGWFTEGFDTPDLKEAKALLEQLRG